MFILQLDKRVTGSVSFWENNFQGKVYKKQNCLKRMAIWELLLERKLFLLIIFHAASAGLGIFVIMIFTALFNLIKVESFKIDVFHHQNKMFDSKNL